MAAGRAPTPVAEQAYRTGLAAAALLEGPSAQGALPPFTASSPPQRLAATIPSARIGRWSGSAWLLLRRNDGEALAQGGTLGGGQAGARIGYRLNRNTHRPLSLAARLYVPARNWAGAEAALGLEWRPVAGLPVSLAAERRQAIGAHGRSALALGAHGGVGDARLPGGVRLDAYAQAGMVGARSRDFYADGAARVTLPAGRFAVGAGLSGGAQPGAARLDAGPVVSLRIPAAQMRVSAEWRFRIAGDARPNSGPALTLGADF